MKSKSKVKSKIAKYKDIRDDLARSNQVAPYMIVNDKVLVSISLAKPRTVEELFDVDGVNVEFISKYGNLFLEKERKTPQKDVSSRTTTSQKSYELFLQGDSLPQISIKRNLKQLTVESHIINQLQDNPTHIDRKRLGITQQLLTRVSNALEQVGKNRLRPIKELLDLDHGDTISYFQIKICLIIL